MVRGKLAIAGLALAVSAGAGCGGSEEVHYTASTTVSCLEGNAGVRDLNTREADLDLVAASRAEGKFRLETASGNVVTVVFESSPEEAEQFGGAYEGLYRRFGSFTYIPYVRGNVTLLWKRSPASRDVDLVGECLSGGGSAIPLEEQDPSTAESFDYPIPAYESYVRECVANGFDDVTCACLLDWAEARYPENEFRVALSRKAVVSAVVSSCSENEASG